MQQHPSFITPMRDQSISLVERVYRATTALPPRDLESLGARLREDAAEIPFHLGGEPARERVRAAHDALVRVERDLEVCARRRILDAEPVASLRRRAAELGHLLLLQLSAPCSL